MDEKCSACSHDALVFYGGVGFLCGEHLRMWQDGHRDDVFDAIARRHTSRMKRREAKLSGPPISQ